MMNTQEWLWSVYCFLAGAVAVSSIVTYLYIRVLSKYKRKEAIDAILVNQEAYIDKIKYIIKALVEFTLTDRDSCLDQVALGELRAGVENLEMKCDSILNFFSAIGRIVPEGEIKDSAKRATNITFATNIYSRSDLEKYYSIPAFLGKFYEVRTSLANWNHLKEHIRKLEKARNKGMSEPDLQTKEMAKAESNAPSDTNK